MNQQEIIDTLAGLALFSAQLGSLLEGVLAER